MKKKSVFYLLTASLLFFSLTINAQTEKKDGKSVQSSSWKAQDGGVGSGYILGDVNGDEKVDISDIVAIINLISKNDKSNKRADVNSDGDVNISDIVKVINIIAGSTTKSLTVDKTNLQLMVGQCEEVFVLSGSGQYEINNMSPQLVSVEQYGTNANQGLKIIALEAGNAVVKIKDRTTNQEQTLNIEVIEADYEMGVFEVIYPKNGTTIEYEDKVGMAGIITHPYDGAFTFQYSLSLYSDMRENCIRGIRATQNGRVGESTFYQVARVLDEETLELIPVEKPSFFDFYPLQPNTKYYWQMSYYDYETGNWIKITPVFWFKTAPGKSDDPAVNLDLCPDSNHPHIIDMGLAGKWSCCNVGAKAPWQYGGYYAWGETEEKDDYSWDTYIHCDDGRRSTCHDLGSDIAGTVYDVAHVKWGGDWQMPSYDRITLLEDNCSTEWLSISSEDGVVTGRKFTGSNGNSIFLPNAGCRSWDDTASAGTIMYYWSSSRNPLDNCDEDEAYMYSKSKKYVTYNSHDRRYGHTVRPVIAEELPGDLAVALGLCPDSSHPHVIDMGEAGMWSCCNVGAAAPWEQGGRYAWGETDEKSDYSWETYIHCDGDRNTCHDIGKDIAGTNYDAAHVNWGGGWQMPSSDQMGLLFDKCTRNDLTIKGVSGSKYTSASGYSIFLPDGTFWSSTLYPDYDYIAYGFSDDGYNTQSTRGRSAGYNIRPIFTDYVTGFCSINSPKNQATLEETSVFFDFSINPIWNGSVIIRIFISEDSSMQTNTNHVDYTLNGKVGTPSSFSSDISGLKPNTKYYWRMAYYDWDTDVYIDCTPVCWFITGN